MKDRELHVEIGNAMVRFGDDGTSYGYADTHIEKEEGTKDEARIVIRVPITVADEAAHRLALRVETVRWPKNLEERVKRLEDRLLGDGK